MRKKFASELNLIHRKHGFTKNKINNSQKHLRLKNIFLKNTRSDEFAVTAQLFTFAAN